MKRTPTYFASTKGSLIFLAHNLFFSFSKPTPQLDQAKCGELIDCCFNLGNE